MLLANIPLNVSIGWAYSKKLPVSMDSKTTKIFGSMVPIMVSNKNIFFINVSFRTKKHMFNPLFIDNHQEMPFEINLFLILLNVSAVTPR